MQLAFETVEVGIRKQGGDKRIALRTTGNTPMQVLVQQPSRGPVRLQLQPASVEGAAPEQTCFLDPKTRSFDLKVGDVVMATCTLNGETALSIRRPQVVAA